MSKDKTRHNEQVKRTHLCHFEPYSADSLSVGNCQVRRQRGVSDDGGERVAVLVGEPFTGFIVDHRTRWQFHQDSLFRQVGMSLRDSNGELGVHKDDTTTTYQYRYTEHALQNDTLSSDDSPSEKAGTHGARAVCWRCSVVRKTSTVG